MKIKLPAITPKTKKIVAAFAYLTAILITFFLSRPLCISLAILPLLYACVRFLPRWISWLPGLVLFFAALLFAENALVHSSRGVSPVTLAWVNIVLCLALTGIGIRYWPKKISWLPGLILLFAAGSTLKGLQGYEATRQPLSGVVSSEKQAKPEEKPEAQVAPEEKSQEPQEQKASDEPVQEK